MGECRTLLDRGSQTKSILIKSRSSENEGPFSCTDSNKRVPVPLVFRKRQMECQAFVCNLWRHFTYGLKILCLRAMLEGWRLRLWRRGKSDFVQAAKMKAIVFRKLFNFCWFLYENKCASQQQTANIYKGIEPLICNGIKMCTIITAGRPLFYAEHH